MIDFLLRYNFIFTLILEFLAVFTGFFYLKKYKYSPAKNFIIFLLIIAICDAISVYPDFVKPDKFLNFLIGTKFQKSHWFTTLYWAIGAILFYAFYFNKVLKRDLFKKIIKYFTYIFFVFSLVYIISNWEGFFVEFFLILDILGALIIFMCSVFYFIEVLISDKILVFYKSINFYISATIFIWWLIITPLSFYDVYYTYEVGKKFLDMNFALLRRQIYLFANIFMYLTFTFALIWCRPQKN